MPARRPPALLLAVLALAFALASVAGRAQTAGSAEIRARRDGAAEVSWRAPTVATEPFALRLLAVNDLHGQLEPHATVGGNGASRRIGGAAVLAAYLAQERALAKGRTLTLIAGDSIGASALVSGLLHDEPTMAVLDELADGDCPRLGRDWPARPALVATRCHTLSTVGNHEFDRGPAELERLLYGGRHPDGTGLERDWRGTRVPFLAANVAHRDGRPFLPAAAVVDFEGVHIGVVGAVTADTPGLVAADRLGDLAFSAEVGPVNAAVAALRAAGVRTVVLLIHEGLESPATPQPTPVYPDELHGGLAAVLRGLDGGVDVVVAGHTHKANNLLVPLKDGTLALVAQARSYGTAYSAIDLVLDRATGAVVEKSARILTTWGDEGPGLAPARRVARIVERAARATAAVKDRPVASAAAPIRRGEASDPESALGDLVADAERAVTGAEVAIVNAGGLRNDIEAGPVSHGALYDVLPFGNVLVRVSLTGAELLELLEEQWSGAHAAAPRFLRVSGLRYVYDPSQPRGRQVVAVEDAAGEPLDPARRYRVVVNDFLLHGGDHYSALAAARDATPLMTDLEALEAWAARARAPLQAHADGRARPFDARPAVIER
ncbi:MAG: bifunctional metallophosphatase/5'-nucleotidase [Proteobacteria bacterium]|nr:bifunctional metallophosphatase/5'-nucleotidase [Pseudomonadota bacterium]